MQLASGDIDVQRGTLSEGTAGVDETVAMMVKLAKGEFGAKSAKIRALAINIINSAGVGDKDYYGMAKAIHHWVRDEIRYIKDPIGQETLSYPEETAFNSKGGDCDDKTILEMGLLGSIGIRSYPVVVGVRPGHFSHVYMNIIIPDGGRPGTHAGDHIPADPIMREWPLGQEAPAHKITQKKTYEDLAGLGNMNLGAYMTGPSYIDQRNVDSVERAMSAALVDTAGRGEILNAPKVNEQNTDEVDSMFTEPAAVVFRSTPWRRLGPEGPITGAEAAGSYTNDTEAPAFTVERARGHRSFVQRTVPVSPRLRGKAANRIMVSDAQSNEEDDVSGLGVYIDSIIGGVLNGDPTQSAAVVHLAHRTAQRADFMPGMGDLAAELRGKAEAVHALASVAPTSDIYNDARKRLISFARRGYMKHMDALRLPTARKVRWISGRLWNHEFTSPQIPLHDEPANRRLDPRLYTQLPFGSVVHARAGAQPPPQSVDGMFDSIAAEVKKPIQKYVPKPIRRVGSVVLNVAAKPLFIATSTIAPKSALAKNMEDADRNTYGRVWGSRIYRAGRVAGTAAAIVMTGGAIGAGAGFAAMGAGASLGTSAAIAGTVGNIAIAAGIGGAALYALKKGAPKKAKTVSGETVYRDAQGNVIPKAEYNRQLAAFKAAEAENARLLAAQGGNPSSATPLQTQVDWAQQYGNQDYNALDYGSQDISQPYGGAGAPYAAPPVDSFGPQDMGPAYSGESSNTAVDPGMSSPADAPQDNSGDGNEQYVDEGEPAPRPAYRRRRTTSPIVSVDASADEGVAPDEDVSDAEEEDSGELDNVASRDQTDINGFGETTPSIAPGMSLATLALIGLGAYLLLKKKG